MQEEWRAVAGYEGRYEVSSLGRVRALQRTVMRRGHALTMPARMMAISPHCETGYNLVRLSSGPAISKMHRVAVLVCEAFHGRRPKGKEAAHRNGVRTDDRANNLRWRTKKQNEAEKLEHGTRPFGVAVHNATLTPAQVLEIRRLRRGGMIYREIADEVGVKFEAVRGVIARGHYPDVKEAA